MAKNKTIENGSSVADYIAAIAEDKKRIDFQDIVGLITEHIGIDPKMWGNAIVGFGAYHYKYDSGHEGSAPLVGLSARVNAISLYIPNFDGKQELLTKFGNHKASKGCVYIQKLEDIDAGILIELVKEGMAYYSQKYPG
jgi:hypothetical protein